MKKTGLLFLVFVMLVSFPGFSQAQDSAVSPGLIAYIGTDYNVYTISAQGGTPTALTQDAGSPKLPGKFISGLPGQLKGNSPIFAPVSIPAAAQRLKF